jgi:copper transport protein
LLLDALHLLATSLWVGGVVVLLLGRRTWLSGGAVASGVIRVLPWALGVVVVTGVLQTWRVVRSASTFGASAYGNLLIGKGAVVLVTVLVLVVGWSASRRTGSTVPARLLAAQVIVGVVALGCSAALVARSPESAVPIAPVTVTASEAGVSVSVTATPARVGGNDFHVLVERADSATPSSNVRMSISRPEAGIGEAEVLLAPDGPDHYSAFGFRIPSAGTWQLVIEVEAADGTTTKLTASLRIAG